MPVVMNAPAMPSHMLRQDILDSTVRVFVGRNYVNRGMWVDVLRSLNVPETDVCGIYHTELLSVWFLEFHSPDLAKSFVTAYPELRIWDRVCHVSLLNCQVVTVKLHWVPSYFSAEYLGLIAGEWGTVRDIVRDRSGHDSVYYVELECSLTQIDAIPHLSILPDGQRLLVVVSGRSPLCLKCYHIGHMMSGCGNFSHVPVEKECQTEISMRNVAVAPPAFVIPDPEALAKQNVTQISVAEVLTPVPEVLTPVPEALVKQNAIQISVTEVLTPEQSPLPEYVLGDELSPLPEYVLCDELCLLLDRAARRKRDRDMEQECVERDMECVERVVVLSDFDFECDRDPAIS